MAGGWMDGGVNLSDTIFVGKVFATQEEAKTCIKDYNKEHFTEFIIDSNHKKAMVAICKHGKKRKSMSKGIRHNLHYNFVGCKAKFNLYKSQVPGSKSLKVTQVLLEHSNHDVNVEVYNRGNVIVTDDDLNIVKTLADANARPSQIKRVLFEKSQKKVTTDKVKRLIAKVSRPENYRETQEQLERFAPGLEAAFLEVQMEPGLELKLEPGSKVKWEPGVEVKLEPGLEIISSEIKSDPGPVRALNSGGISSKPDNPIVKGEKKKTTKIPLPALKKFALEVAPELKMKQPYLSQIEHRGQLNKHIMKMWMRLPPAEKDSYKLLAGINLDMPPLT